MLFLSSFSVLMQEPYKLQNVLNKGPGGLPTDAATINTISLPHAQRLQDRRHSVTRDTAVDRSLGIIRHSTQACDTFQALLFCSLAVQLDSEQMMICHVTLQRHSLGHIGVPSYFLHI